MSRPSFKVGDVIISRQQPPITIRDLPQSQAAPVVRERAPSFKATTPGPRTFLGIEAFRAKELREKGLKIDLGSVKVSVPVLDDRDNPINDASGNPVMKEKSIRLSDIGKTLSEKLDNLKRIIQGGADEIKNNQLVLNATIQGILDSKEDLDEDSLSLLERGLAEAKFDPDAAIDALGAAGNLDDDFVVFGPRGFSRSNRSKLARLLAVTHETVAGIGNLALPENEVTLTVDKPVIGVGGTPISANRIKFNRGHVLFTRWRDEARKMAPRVFRTMTDARNAVLADSEGEVFRSPLVAP